MSWIDRLFECGYDAAIGFKSPSFVIMNRNRMTPLDETCARRVSGKMSKQWRWDSVLRLRHSSLCVLSPFLHIHVEVSVSLSHSLSLCVDVSSLAFPILLFS